MSEHEQLACPSCAYRTMSTTPKRAENALRMHLVVHEPGGGSHGTRSGFVMHHQRGEDPCEACKAAAYEYHHRYYQEARKFVDGVPHVPAGKVLAHVARLRAGGMGTRRIAEKAGVSLHTVQHLGKRSKGIRPVTARRLLAVQADPFWRPAEPVRRRVRALAVIGWDARSIADRAGVSIAVVADLTAGRTVRVSEKSDEALRAVYEDLCMTPGPSARVQRYATAKGWVPPLGWDDIDRDEHPADAVVVPVRQRVDLDEWVHLVSLGVGAVEAAGRVGGSGLRSIQDAAAKHQHARALRLLAEVVRTATAQDSMGRETVDVNNARARRLEQLADLAGAA